jgi:HK97 family phage prohead protease
MINSRVFPFEIKSIADSGVIEGVISAFGQVDSYGDTIERGAYTKSIERLRREDRKLPLLYQHDPSRPIGVWTDLAERSDGLFGKAELVMEVPDAIAAHALARKGALTGISIGFRVGPDGAHDNGKVRILSEIDLVEASLVTFPADTHARVTAVKSIRDAKDIADLLRAAGLSGREAKRAAGAAWRAINDTEDDEAAAAVLSGAMARLTDL